MGRFESYPETDALNDNDITLYNHTNNTNKITFINLVNLIKTKLQSIGIIAIDTGVGLSSDGTITSNGTIKCDLKSETPASISSANISTVNNRQYAVGVDKDGHLSVNVPWEGSSTTYSAGSGINIINNTISTKLKSNTQSLLTASNMGSTANRQYAVGLDSQNYLSVNIPWVEYSADKGIILNNNSHNLSANLKSYTQSSLSSTSMGSTANRQYAVGLDKDGYLSVNVPWEGGSTIYTAGSGINISNNTIKVKLKSYTQSSLTSASITSIANKQYAVNLDSSGVLSVNVPWENTTYSSLAPVENGTNVSLVTTGEKYNWNNTGTVKQITLGEGLTGDSTITSTGTIKVKLKSYTKSSLTATSMGSTSNRQYAVGLDHNGDLSVNVPWENTLPNNGSLTIKQNGTEKIIFTANQSSSSEVNIITPTKLSELTNDSGYTTNTGTVTRVQTGVGLVGDITTSGTIKTKLKSETASTLSSTSMGSTSNRQYAVGLDKDGYLSVNIPWDGGMAIDGSNAASEVVFNGKFTVGSRKANTTHGVNSVAEGSSVAAEGNYSHAEGGSTTASGAYSHAEGEGTTASGTASHAEGSYGVASGMGSHIEGGVLKGAPISFGLYESQDNNTKIVRTSDNSFVSGKTYYVPPFVITPTGGENPKAMKWLELQSTNTYIYSTDTIVDSSKQYYNCDVIFGGTYSQTAKGYFSHSEGNHAVANGNYSHAEGQATTASGSASHAEGYKTQAEGNYSHAEGYNTIATGEISHAEGKHTVTIGIYSHAEGEGTAAGYDHQHVSGKFNSNKSTTLFEVGNGTTSTSRSNAFEVYSDGNISTNNGTTKVKLENLALKSEVPDASAFMIKSNPQGTGSFSLNRASGATVGAYSFAEGYDTIASGDYSHAEGINTTASGVNSHTEGYNTTASGNHAHAEGFGTEAGGNFSHAEGDGSSANGDYSHAEGQSTQAEGNYSHAEGYNTHAIGDYSHAGGAYVVTSYACQLAQGGSNDKFGNVQYGKGVFCVSPDTLIVHESGTTVDATNGISGTNDGGYITLILDICAMYILYHTSYNGTSVERAGICLISTPATRGTPYVQPLMGSIISNTSPNAITLYDANRYMFHLIRII